MGTGKRTYFTFHLEPIVGETLGIPLNPAALAGQQVQVGGGDPALLGEVVAIRVQPDGAWHVTIAFSEDQGLPMAAGGPWSVSTGE